MSNKMFSFLAAVVCAAGVSMSVYRAEAGPSRVETCLKDDGGSIAVRLTGLSCRVMMIRGGRT